MAINSKPDIPTLGVFCVEFELPSHLGIYVDVPAMTLEGAKLRAWALFSEHRWRATNTSVSRLEYAEIDWQTGRCIVVKKVKRPFIPIFKIDELDEQSKRKERGRASPPD